MVMLENSANADLLFENFLKYIINDKQQYKEWISISEIEKKISVFRGKMNKSTYDQSILRMLSSVRGRDYFIFEEITIKDILDEECRKTNRYNLFYDTIHHEF